MNWTEKYKPSSLKEVHGNVEELMLLKKLILEKKPIILHGNTGTGKTCSVYAIANELNYEVIETNTSELRNKENVNLIIGKASGQKSLFKAGKILLIDEIDGLTGKDRGGANTILSVINQCKASIVLTANNPYASKLSSIRRKCNLIKFNDLNVYNILYVLKKILKKEKIKCKDGLLLGIAKHSKGDLRAAINDLQVNASGKKEIKELYFGEREKKEDIFKILREIFKKKNVEGVADKLDVDYDELLLWLEENLPREYRGKELAKGFEMLSKADIFRKRIRRQQHWRFLVYIRDLLTHGVALSKEKENRGFISYKRGQRILKLWIAKQKYLKKKQIAKKIAQLTHDSSKNIIKDFYYYQILANKGVDFNLDEEEVEWLKSKNL